MNTPPHERLADEQTDPPPKFRVMPEEIFEQALEEVLRDNADVIKALEQY